MWFDKMNLITNAYVVAIVDIVGPILKKICLVLGPQVKNLFEH
jgi:hypothetical protein